MVLTAMAKDVNTRYQSADELRADLMRFERGRPLLGGPAAAVAATVATPRESFVVAAPVESADRGGPPPAGVATLAATRPRARRGNRWAAIIAIGTAFALLLALIVVLLADSDIGDAPPAVETADVPRVLGKTFDAASADLKAAGFEVTRQDEQRPEDANLVIGQDPEEGRKVKKGSTVLLRVSSATIPAPDLVGLSRADAASKLAASRLVGGFVEVDTPDRLPGTVLSQNPAGGAPVNKDLPWVQVTVAKEPGVPVPNVDGQDQTAGSRDARDGGLHRDAAQRPERQRARRQGDRHRPTAGHAAAEGQRRHVGRVVGPRADRHPEHRRADAGRRHRGVAQRRVRRLRAARGGHARAEGHRHQPEPRGRQGGAPRVRDHQRRPVAR